MRLRRHFPVVVQDTHERAILLETLERIVGQLRPRIPGEMMTEHASSVSEG